LGNLEREVPLHRPAEERQQARLLARRGLLRGVRDVREARGHRSRPVFLAEELGQHPVVLHGAPS